MDEVTLHKILDSNRSLNSVYTSLGKALAKGDLAWLTDRYSTGTPNEKLFMYVNKLTELPTCKMCDSSVKFKGYSRGFAACCSPKCARAAEVKSGASLTIREKMKQTLQENYGVTSPFELATSKQAHAAAMHARRGLATSEAVKERTKASLLERYGVTNPGQIPTVREQVNATMKERYGGYFIGQLGPKLKRERWVERITELLKTEHNVTLLEPLQDSKTRVEARHNCGTTFALDVSNGSINRCPKCYFQPANRSALEDSLSRFVGGFGYPTLTNVKSNELIWPLSLDIWVPEKRIAIEVNGDYWHNTAHIADDYHLEKLEACTKKGIKLIQIFEHDLVTKRALVEERLRSAFGIYERRIGARECVIEEIGPELERPFLEAGHLQGYVPSKLTYGLKHQGELVMLMSFGKPRFNKNVDYELLRVCSKPGVLVIGGASKLLNRFLTTVSSSLLSYHDRCWGVGEFYTKLGFILLQYSAPGFFYVKNGKKLSRYQAQKQRLPAVLGEKFNPKLTGDQNMLAAGWNKIYDCGQEVYLMRKTS